MIDSGITSAHPLLSNNVGHEQAVLLNTASAADQHGHGTMVGALAVFGDVRAAYLSGRFASEVTLFSARVLNNRNEFDDEQLRITQIRKAIEAFIADPYKCRVFNISIGTVDSAFKNGRERQTEWAEELDILAREYKVLIVVSAGNNPVARAGMPGQAEEAFDRYPQQLFTAENRINDPGSAAIAVTVGAISEHDQPGRNPGNVGDDIRQAVAGINGPSPFTRVGPGIAGAIKPEFVEYGGNYAFRGRGIVRQVAEDDNTSIMSFHRVPSEKLFTFDNGNSYSAATVSHAAAKILKRLEDTPALNGATPDPNLVRAVMGICAFVPSEAAAQLAQCEEDAVLRSYGYGRINLDLALRSKDRFAVMVAQERIELDKFMLFRIPITDDFTSAPGAKYIRVALAFDPPVRRRRQNYLGVEMSFDVIRGMTPDQIVEAYRALESDEDADVVGRAPSGSNRVVITPSTQSRTGSKLSRNRSTLQVGEAKFFRMNDYGNTYYVVVRCQRKWAPDTVALQDFGIAVALTAENDRLFTSLRARVRMPVRTRAQS
ncbi:S8 family peptidase [Oscillatoria laete-virens NRMC-F 0139]|nr:S8 family peptidase [Oscillatoria laete-virens NRMC-F 0139]